LIKETFTILTAYLLHGVDPGPIFGLDDRLARSSLPRVGHVIGQGVVGVGAAQQRLDRQQHRPNLQGRRPLVFQNVQADPPELVDVGVVDFSEEAHVGRRQGVVFGKEQLQPEEAPLVGGPLRPRHHDVEVPAVVVVGESADAGGRILRQVFGFDEYSSRRAVRHNLKGHPIRSTVFGDR
jgi:hypothetical protein